MREMLHPKLRAMDIVQACIDGMRIRAQKEMFERAVDDISSEEVSYIIKAINGDLHAANNSNTINGEITKTEMINLYDYRMLRTEQVRVYYDAIMSSAPDGNCPLCDVRNVTTLDHYLPKARFPYYSVSPSNLIPACKDCNTNKLEDIPTGNHDLYLHPYYDNVNAIQWLFGDVKIRKGKLYIDFRVNPPLVWNITTRQRLSNNFSRLKLNDLYSLLSGSEITGILDHLSDLLEEHGSSYVKLYLLGQARSRKKLGVNSWQYATYYVLHNDDWFCEGGFMSI